MGAGLWPQGAALGARGWLCAGLRYWRWLGLPFDGMVVVMTQTEALRLALEALEGVLDDSPKVMEASISGGLYEVVQCRDAITAIKASLEAKDEPVDLSYQPDWKEEYQKAVELHCITLDELREGMALNRKLEKTIATQDALLERQTARIVELQEHIENFDGEDR
jgi:hypothetical protein